MGYLTTWNPFRTSVGSLFTREMTDLFDRFFGDSTQRRADLAFVPAMEVEETSGDFRIKVELPGLTEKDVKVNFTGDMLFVRGEKKEEREEKDRNIHVSERIYGQFERSLRLPTPVKADSIKAIFEHGVLRITVPKADEVKPREIEIKVAK